MEHAIWHFTILDGLGLKVKCSDGIFKILNIQVLIVSITNDIALLVSVFSYAFSMEWYI